MQKPRFFLPLLFACSVLALSLVSSANAQPANTTTLLDDAYATLAQAKHDYHGHRVRAMKQIELALGEAGAKVSGHGHNREPQGTSDAQLKAAEALLQEASPGLSGRALQHVKVALLQIQTALSVR